MSRIGNNPINIPEGVKIDINDNIITVTGKNGTQEWSMDPSIKATVENGIMSFNRNDNSSNVKALHGTTRQIINNMVLGVSVGFKKELEIIGVGYQASIQGKRLLLQLGYSHDIYFDLPDDIKATADRTSITVVGVDKQLVGSIASKIRSFRSPEPYKGKGIRYKDEHVRIKQGKTVGE